MDNRVAAVEFGTDVQESYDEALRLLGGIDDLNSAEKHVVVKLGVFSPKTGIHTTVNTVRGIINSFGKTPKIFLAESDSYGGKALERLQIWGELFNERVIPFSLSTDEKTRGVKVADEKVALSHVLFKPNVLVSTHVPRRYEEAGIAGLMNTGSVLKNLLGLIPDKKKYRFHEKLATALLDMYEAIGGIDLAVLDGAYTYLGGKRKRKRIETNFLLVGRNAVSVEAVGSYVVGLDPLENPVIQEATNRGLGEGEIDKIEVLGSSIEELRRRVTQSSMELFQKRTQRMKG